MWHDQQVRNSKYRNWVKAGLGLKYLGNGLAPFVDETVKTQHVGMLEDIEKTYGARTRCDKCKLENLMPIHTSDQNKRCPFNHKPVCNCRSPHGKILCPTRFCSAFYEKLIIQHRYLSPNWKNTKITQWFDNHWQIAKTFIPAGGYERHTSVQDTDCAGLLNIIINNTAMYSLLDTVIDTPNDIFSKTRKARDDIFHSSSFEIEDDQFIAMINDMTAILEDKKQLKDRTEATEAKKNLLRLRDEDFVITLYDEATIRKSAMDAIDEMKTQALASIGDKQQQVIDEIQACSLQQTTATGSIERRLHGTEQTLQNLQQKQNEVETSVENLRDSHVQLQQDVKDISQELASLKSDELYLKTKAEHRERLKYIQDKQALQQDLACVYKKYYSSIPVHPLMQENEVSVEEIYVKPAIRMIRSKQIRQRNAKREITSYKDIFWSENVCHQNVYVTGDAGIGKSAFCKQLINAWCKVHTQPQQQNESDVHPANEFAEISQELKAFEFLFFIALRHSKTEIHVHDMIKNQLLQTNRYKDLFDKIIEEDSEKCLIILDGLDEWRETTETAVPVRMLMAKYTVLTTSRPWRIETVRLKDAEVDVNLELDGVDPSAADSLARKMIEHLNKTFSRSRELKCFEREVLIKDLSQLKRVPILLQQMVCVWHDLESLGTSQCDIYSSMLDLLIDVAELKHRLEPLSTGNDASNCLPSCLNDKLHCRVHQLLIMSLAKVAFETLFTKQSEPVLVFPSSQMEICGMSTCEMDQCLAIGILTQNEAKGISAVTRYKNIAFIHKTFQEFLAAVYIATNCARSASERQTGLSREILDVVFDKCLAINEVLAYSVVFKFLCGMNPDVGKIISEHVQRVVVDQRNKSNTFLPASTYSKGFHSAVCGRLMGENNESIDRINALFLDWIDEAKKCGHLNIQLVCSEITDSELYNYVDPRMVKAASFFWMDILLYQSLDLYGPLTSLHMSDCYSVELMKDTIFNLILRSKHTLKTLHLDLLELTRYSKSGQNQNMVDLLVVLHQLSSLQNVALTNITGEHNIIQGVSSFFSNLSNLTSVYLENIACLESDTGYPVAHERGCSIIDLSSRASSKIHHIHTLASGIVFSGFTPANVQVLCVDENTVDVLKDKLKMCKNLRVFTFFPSFGRWEVPYGHFLNDFDTLSAIASAIPTLKYLVHIQISFVDFRCHELVLSQEMKSLSTLELSNIRIKDRALNKLCRTIPCINDLGVLCSQVVSGCMEDLYVDKLKMNFHGEQEENVKCVGMQKLSTPTHSLVTKLFNSNILVALSIVGQ